MRIGDARRYLANFGYLLCKSQLQDVILGYTINVLEYTKATVTIATTKYMSCRSRASIIQIWLMQWPNFWTIARNLFIPEFVLFG